MKTSVVIPTFNGCHKLERLFSSLEKQTYLDFETIVVVDGSTDDTVKFLNTKLHTLSSLTVINQENRGRAAARNAGVAAANGELIIFFDDDMVLEDSVLEKHIVHHTTISSSILIGNLCEDEVQAQNDVQRYKAHITKRWMDELGFEKRILDGSFLSAANMSIPRAIFESLGGFDERLRDCEDYEFAIRLAKAAVPVIYDPLIVAWHVDRITAHSYANRLKEYKRNRDRVHEIHPDLKERASSAKHFKNLIYFLFSFRFWLAIIENNLLAWMPRGLRYKFYGAVFHSQTVYSR